MDGELWNQIEEYVSTHSELKWMSDQECLASLEALSRKFAIPATQIWWWEARRHTRHVVYGDTDGLAVIQNMIGQSTEVLLFVTDDDPPPWLCIAGQLDHVLLMIREQRYFEFFITDRALDWIVFDTHHNELIIIGDPPLP